MRPQDVYDVSDVIHLLELGQRAFAFFSPFKFDDEEAFDDGVT